MDKDLGTESVHMHFNTESYDWHFTVYPNGNQLHIMQNGWDRNYSQNFVMVASEWEQFVRLILETYIQDQDTTGWGVEVLRNRKNDENYLIAVNMIGQDVSIPCDELEEWLRSFVKFMEDYYGIQDSILG
jgi:hypothetical protein